MIDDRDSSGGGTHRPGTEARVEVLGGHCTVDGDELVISRSVVRAINPLTQALVGAIFVLTVLDVTTELSFSPAIENDRHLLALGVAPIAILVVDCYWKGALGRDRRVPLDDVRDVRIGTETRRWYAKKRLELPKVVLSVDGTEGTEERSIRLHTRDAVREAEALLNLLERHGVAVSRPAELQVRPAGGPFRRLRRLM